MRRDTKYSEPPEDLPFYKNLDELYEDERPSLDIMILGYFTRKGYNGAIQALRIESPSIKDLIAKAEAGEASANVSTMYCGSTLEQIYGTWAKTSGPTFNSLATFGASSTISLQLTSLLAGTRLPSVWRFHFCPEYPIWFACKDRLKVQNATMDRPGFFPPYCRELMRHGDLFLNGLRMIFAKGGFPITPLPPSPAKTEPQKQVVDASCGTETMHQDFSISPEMVLPSISQSVCPTSDTSGKAVFNPSPEKAPSVSSLGERSRRKRNEPRHLNAQQQAKIEAEFIFPPLPVTNPANKAPQQSNNIVVSNNQQDSLDAELEAHMEALRKKDIDQIRLELALELAGKIGQANGDLGGVADSLLDKNNVTAIIETHLVALMNSETKVDSDPNSAILPRSGDNAKITLQNYQSTVSPVRERDLSTPSLNQTQQPIMISRASPACEESEINNSLTPDEDIDLIPSKKICDSDEQELRLVDRVDIQETVTVDAGVWSSFNHALESNVDDDRIEANQSLHEHSCASGVPNVETASSVAVQERKDAGKETMNSILNLSTSSTESISPSADIPYEADPTLNLSTSNFSPLQPLDRNLKTPDEHREELTPSRQERLQQDLQMSPTPEKTNFAAARCQEHSSPIIQRIPSDGEVASTSKSRVSEHGNQEGLDDVSENELSHSPCPPTPTLHSSASKLSNHYFPIHENSRGVKKCIRFYPEDFSTANETNSRIVPGTSNLEPARILEEIRVKTPSIPADVLEEQQDEPTSSPSFLPNDTTHSILHIPSVTKEKSESSMSSNYEHSKKKRKKKKKKEEPPEKIRREEEQKDQKQKKTHNSAKLKTGNSPNERLLTTEKSFDTQKLEAVIAKLHGKKKMQ